MENLVPPKRNRRCLSNTLPKRKARHLRGLFLCGFDVPDSDASEASQKFFRFMSIFIQRKVAAREGEEYLV